MTTSIATIDEYINQFDGEKKEYLIKVRQLIAGLVPPDAEETISYQMPTFRYKGNIIHFAMNKNHLGLYPGPAAIEHFITELKNFKTTKGAIQIPLDQPIPTQLITDIVNFNIDKLKDKQGPNWYQSRGNWQEAEELMQEIIQQTSLKKEFKWGSYIYTHKGKNVIGWGGFKNFFSLWFYNGVFLTDRDKHLISASEGKTKALRQWRFEDVKDMNAEKIAAYIQESIQTINEGKELKPTKSPMKAPAGLLLEALQTDPTFAESFQALTPGKQKEYIEYIDEAKQEKTKQSRIEKIKPLVLAKKGLNDKYK
ncbi:DUF1801 domain-containing protein [Sphingobacterium multivorum]|uniref:Uncharacterized conserved protein n=1 Tax=Sphingobacterium multivorum TaxID=28454 RepID=A0A2X2JC95_SPHMU|nr:DUF1801 domain-containing protein [Sphingobacterium multivorum]QRQ60160.1 DUF1801 domain-containing protein [Sphingobacterium multivorum]SPZ91942.1 Uncharacterized conserved protein [Sphingobacterium multivorum]